MPVISDTPGYLIVTDDIDTGEFNVANKLLKLDGNVKTPFAQSLALSRATQPLNSKGNTFATIQATIDDMDIAGWVYVPPGTYTEALDIVGKNNIMLSGAGWGMSRITYGGNDHTLDIDNSDDVILRDLRIDQTSTGNNVNAIRLDDVQKLRIENVYFGDSDQYTIEFVDATSEECKITGCYFTGADEGGIISWNDKLNTKLKVINNFFSLQYPVSIWGDYCIVKENTVETSKDDAIFLFQSPHSIVSENIVSSQAGALGSSIKIKDSDYCVISNNTVHNTPEHGIYLDCGNHCSLIGNTVVNSSIRTANAYDGIYIYHSDYNTITGNVAYDDHLGCAGAGCQRRGITVVFSLYASLCGNICRNNRSDGILVQGSIGHVADYNTLQGNVCEGNGGRGIYIFGDKAGGHDYANKNIVVGNQLYDNTGTNLDDDGTATQKGYNVT